MIYLLFKKLNDLYITNKKFNDLLMYFAYFFLILNDIYVKLLQFIFFEHHHIGNYMHCTNSIDMQRQCHFPMYWFEFKRG
jgi:hypothetical protein